MKRLGQSESIGIQMGDESLFTITQARHAMEQA